MKKIVYPVAAGLLCLLLGGCSASQGASAVLAVLGIAALALAGLRTYSLVQYNRNRRARRRPRPMDMLTKGLYALGALVLLASLIVSCSAPASDPEDTSTPPESTGETQAQESQFHPAMTTLSDPKNWSVRWEIFDGGTITHAYDRSEPITFGAPESYFALPGVPTFRGDNYRSGSAYGLASVKEETLTSVWTQKSKDLPGGIWEGSGWTGQPLVVQWDAQTRNAMNLYDSKKVDGLVEVIYATLDGHIYFLDLRDGSYTRDPINVGMCFKGSGALDPRGYPLLYVGSGDENIQGQRPRMFIISLIDGSILYEYGHEEDLSYRRDNDNWCAFDSSPLVDAETDTLIWPGENGCLYTIKLNTNYSAAAGTLAINPDKPVLTRYLTGRTSGETYWSGYEASACIVEKYLYVSENGGLFYCVDLNTMELVWAQDTEDDSNSSPIFQRISDTEGYLYTAPSLHWTQDSNANGTVKIYKLDAVTGEIVWTKPYDVTTVDGISGGVQSTGLLGKVNSNLDGMVFYTIARTPSKDKGLLVALDTETGEEIWRMNMNYYTWSSPVGVYNAKGEGYLVVCDTAGQCMLIDGTDGKVLSTVKLGGLVEATPVVYENMLVVGTRGKQICGVRID